MNGLINVGILRPELAGSFGAGYKQAEEQRNLLAQQQQQRQLGELQLQNALREQRLAGEEEAAYKAAGSDYARLQAELMQRGLGKQALAVGAQQAKAQADRITMLKNTTELMKSAATSIMASPTLENALGTVRAFGQRTGMDVSADIQRLMQLGNNPEAIKEWAAGHAVSADKLLPNFEKTDLGGTVQRQGFSPITGAALGAPTVLEKTATPGDVLSSQTQIRGQDIGAATAREGQRITLRGQDLTDARERERIKQEGIRIGFEGRRVAVAEQQARQQADPVFQQRMAQARATGEAIAKGDVAAQQALPAVTDRAERGIRLLDELVGRREVRDASGKVIQPGTAPHPGFQDAVGATWKPGARFVPGTNAAGFMARFDEIKGGSFLEAFESLRGGGAISEKEGEKATSAINRMSIATDEKEFTEAARDLQDIMRKGLERAKAKASGARPSGGASGKWEVVR